MGSYNVCYLSRIAFAFSNKYSRSKIKFEIIVSVLAYGFNILISFFFNNWYFIGIFAHGACNGCCGTVYFVSNVDLFRETE